MTEQQMQLIMQIVREQLEDYLEEELAGRIAAGIEEGINDNRFMMEKLEVTEAEIEGGGSSWWYVCGDCHGQVDSRDAYCRHCGTRIGWSEKNTLS